MWWRRASPSLGWYFIYGKEEVFEPNTRDFVAFLKGNISKIDSHAEEGWLHAWPIVKLFLCNEEAERLSGLRLIVEWMGKRIVAKIQK
jgi:hypothetical protein